MERDGFGVSKAIVLVDVQRGFMPASEGKRLNAPGFGELPVNGGENIVQPINELLEWAAKRGYIIVSTQDWHPPETAHFSKEPNYKTTWPVHCVMDTPGGYLHPELKSELIDRRFVKGTEELTEGDTDTSYSGYFAYHYDTGEMLPMYLKRLEVTETVIVGLAYDYCVGETALDLKSFELSDHRVIVLPDLTRGVDVNSNMVMADKLDKAGVELMHSEDYTK